MTRIISIALGLVAFANAAGAVTLVIESDKLTYAIGETVVLTVTGAAQGGKDSEIYGRLEYAAALTTTLTSGQTEHTYDGGIPAAVVFPLEIGDGFAEVFYQIIEPNLPRLVDQLQIATATLLADAAGVVNVVWSEAGDTALDYYGLETAPGTSFTIVPEPSAIGLLSLGLLALAARRRR